MRVVLQIVAILFAQLYPLAPPAPTVTPGVVAFSAACTGTSGSTNTTATLSCSPANGSQFVLGLQASGGAITGASCSDNNSVSLTAGPTETWTPGEVLEFTYVVSGSPTSFICNWTTSRAFSVGGVSYTGNGSVNLTPTSNTATANSASPSVSPVSTVTNDFMVAICGFSGNKSWTTPKTGNERATVSNANGSQALIDNPSGGTSGSGVTEQDTVTGGSVWGCAAIELKP